MFKNDTGETALHKVGAFMAMIAMTMVFLKEGAVIKDVPLRPETYFWYALGMAISYLICSFKDVTNILAIWLGAWKNQKLEEDKEKP